VEAPSPRLPAGTGSEESQRHYIGLLTSRPIADAIIQKFDLAKAYRAKDMTKAARNLRVIPRSLLKRTDLSPCLLRIRTRSV